jgi:hypothetical protein
VGEHEYDHLMVRYSSWWNQTDKSIEKWMMNGCGLGCPEKGLVPCSAVLRT